MDVAVDASGAWAVHDLLPAAVSAVREVLDDPRRAAVLAPDFKAIAVRESPPCQDLSMTVNGPFRSILYGTRRCPTATGWRYDLVRSDTITDFYAEWTVAEAGTLTDVRYTLRTDVNLPFPRVVISSSVRSAAVGTVENLRRAVTAAR